MSAGQEKGSHGGKACLHGVDGELQQGYIFLFQIGNFQFWLFIRVAGQGGADGEEAVLYFPEEVGGAGKEEFGGGYGFGSGG